MWSGSRSSVCRRRRRSDGVVRSVGAAEARGSCFIDRCGSRANQDVGRGPQVDLVTVAVSGDYGKPRPALVIQTDHLPETNSVLVCLLTTTIRDAPLFRFPLPATEETGLAQPSQVMVDKIMAVRRDRCGAPIGKVDPAAMLALNRLLAFVVGVTG